MNSELLPEKKNLARARAHMDEILREKEMHDMHRCDIENRLRKEFNIPDAFDFNNHIHLLNALDAAAKWEYNYASSGDQHPCPAYDVLVTKFAKWMAACFFSHDTPDGLYKLHV